MGITPCHHGGALGDAHIRLPQPHAALPGQSGEPLNRGVQKLRIGWKGDVLGLHGGIDRDPRQILRPQRSALVRHPQALGQEKFQLAAEALAPMAQVRALVRKLVLEELLSGEVLEVWIIDPAFAHAFVGQSVNMLEQKKPDHKPCRNSRPTTVAVQRRDLAVDELPVDLAGELHQLVPHVDDLIQPRPERAYPFEGSAKTKLQASRASNTETLQSQVNKAAKKRLSLSGLEVLHGRLFKVGFCSNSLPGKKERRQTAS